jgi:hypothetical protein
MALGHGHEGEGNENIKLMEELDLESELIYYIRNLLLSCASISLSREKAPRQSTLEQS